MVSRICRGGGDLFSAGGWGDVNADDSLRDAKNIVDTIAEQFDSGSYNEDSPEVGSAMYFLALEWARIGWAKSLKGERLEGLRFMDSAWILSQSGTLANRLARFYAKAGDAAKAKSLFLLAAAAGGSEVENSRAELKKMGASADLAPAQAALLQMRTVKLSGLAMKKGQAEFALVFNGSSKAERAEYAEGDPDLRSAEQALLDATYTVSFPDYSSLKIVRRGVLSCGASGSSAVLNPIQNAGLVVGSAMQK